LQPAFVSFPFTGGDEVEKL